MIQDPKKTEEQSKELTRQEIEEHRQLLEEKELANKLLETVKINAHLIKEVESVSGENSTILNGNQQLKNQYESNAKRHEELTKEYKEVESSITTLQIKYNSLTSEIAFLQEERHKLQIIADEKYQKLAELMRRYNAIKDSYEFVKGETTFSQDLLKYSEDLLMKALKQKQSFDRKLDQSEESLDQLFNGLDEVVRQGHVTFYTHRQ